MSTPPRQEYLTRLNRVVDYIDAHLSEPLPLDTLARLAHFSPYHFHRLFLALTGETLGDCIRRRRLERAANLLLVQTRRTILSVALDVGFESAEVFARNFRRHFGCTATAWRQGAWREGKNRQAPSSLDQAGAAPGGDTARMNLPTTPVIVGALPEYRLAYQRAIGPYHLSAVQAWERLMQWRERHDVMVREGVAFGIPHDNPLVTAPENCRYDACLAVAGDFTAAGDVGVQTLAGGRWARRDFIGTALQIVEAWTEFFAQWLPDSGYTCDDRPLVEMYDLSRPDDSGPGRFRCTLCIPVVPL